MSYDSECAVLARHFLGDIGHGGSHALVANLAQHIQDAVEVFLRDDNLAHVPPYEVDDLGEWTEAQGFV